MGGKGTPLWSLSALASRAARGSSQPYSGTLRASIAALARAYPPMCPYGVARMTPGRCPRPTPRRPGVLTGTSPPDRLGAELGNRLVRCFPPVARHDPLGRRQRERAPRVALVAASSCVSELAAGDSTPRLGRDPAGSSSIPDSSLVFSQGRFARSGRSRHNRMSLRRFPPGRPRGGSVFCAGVPAGWGPSRGFSLRTSTHAFRRSRADFAKGR
jgi:hypothetical protein